MFGWGHLSGWADWGIAIFGLWVPAAVNLAGVRQMAWFQNDIDGELGCAHRGLLL